MPDLLIELFSEEIPARMQARAAQDLKKLVTDGLVEAGLTYASAGAFHTPRRLALAVDGLTGESPARREERKGPRADAPEKALEGFLRSTGLSRDQLESRDTPKGAVFFAVIEHPGRPAAEIVAEVVPAVIKAFPWPKSMKWGATPMKWVRPLQSIICILSDEVGTQTVALTIHGITAGDTTQGHRFMADGAIKVANFDDYSTKLKAAHVMLDADERAAHIWADATNLAFAQGMEVVEDARLLTEVAGLVEWPVALMGTIDAAYLDLPGEVLQTSMRSHQKFFSVRNPKSGRIEKFVTVANVATPDNGAAIVAGNQKVLAARLADAKFFWDNDLRVATQHKMQPWLDQLDRVTFHAKLGSQGDRVARVAALAREIAPLVDADADQAEAAARFAKADLASEMVQEFPELQGVMGRYYVAEAGHAGEIAQAAQDHYAPQGPSDSVPTAPVSVAVALADKLDTLCGFWAIDEKPTGSKDPFALRRAALGVIRLVLDLNNKISLIEILKPEIEMRTAIAIAKEIEKDDPTRADYAELSGTSSEALRYQEIMALVNSTQPLSDQQKRHKNMIAAANAAGVHLLAFFHDRLKVHLRDQGIRHDVIDACLAMPNNDDLTLLVKRATALAEFLKTDDGESLLQGFKRANNILSQAEAADGVEYSYGADAKFAQTSQEKALFAALDRNSGAISGAVSAEDFTAAMAGLATLRAPIDAFFEATQINTDNELTRRNRLNLLSDIRKLCLSVADLTRIAG